MFAFDPNFSSDNFFKYHVFTGRAQDVFNDIRKHREYNERFMEVLHGWSGIIETIPEEWFFFDSQLTMPVNFDLKKKYNILTSFLRGGFWNTP